MEFLQILENYGWIGVIILFFIDKVWPRAFDIFKGRADLSNEEMRLKMQQGIEEAKAERDARAAERQFRHELDERQIKAYEKLVETTQLQAQLLVTMNERLNQLTLKQNTMNSFIVDAVAQMRERMAINHPPIQKLPPKEDVEE